MPQFKDFYVGKRVLITGNTGFKGSWMSLWLNKLGAEVWGLSMQRPSEPMLYDSLGLREIVNGFSVDLKDLQHVNKIILKLEPNIIFHLAAQSIVHDSYIDPVETFRTNVMGSIHIMEACRQLKKPCSLIMVTSDKCYENNESLTSFQETSCLGGKDPYSASKGATEIAIRSYYHSFFGRKHSTIKIASARAGNIIGGGDWKQLRLIPDCIQAWRNHKAVTIRNPESIRPWQHVLEALSGYLWLAVQLNCQPQINGEAFNFGPLDSKYLTVKQIVEILAENFSGSSNKIKNADDVETSFSESNILMLNAKKAKKLLNWHTILSTEQCIKWTAKWYEEYYKKPAESAIICLDQIEDYTSLAIDQNLLWAK